jgi:hypothetical protein
MNEPIGNDQYVDDSADAYQTFLKLSQERANKRSADLKQNRQFQGWNAGIGLGWGRGRDDLEASTNPVYKSGDTLVANVAGTTPGVPTSDYPVNPWGGGRIIPKYVRDAFEGTAPNTGQCPYCGHKQTGMDSGSFHLLLLMMFIFLIIIALLVGTGFMIIRKMFKLMKTFNAPGQAQGQGQAQMPPVSK